MSAVTDHTAIRGQVDLEPGTGDPVRSSEGGARIARLQRGLRELSEGELAQRQLANSMNVPGKEDGTTGCVKSLYLSVYFDGTGNNRDAELDKPEGDRALSNIARLYESHQTIDEHRGLWREYIAGVGTPCAQVGDNGGVRGLALGAGGGERNAHALKVLDDLVDSQPSSMSILVVTVSVFGFSRGAVSARAFARDLAERCKPSEDGRWIYRDRVPLRISFMGVFDTVCSVWPAFTSAAINFRSGHNGWAKGMRIPAMVEQSVHMTAAHELRGQFSLDSTRDHDAYPDNTVEIWFPGVHSDIGGGYDPRHQGRRNSIARFSLNEMYEMARVGGVLLKPVDELAPFLKSEFDKNDVELQAVFNGYLEAMPIKRGRFEDLQAAHMALLHRWLRVRTERGDLVPSMERLAERQAELEAEIRTLRSQRKPQRNAIADEGGQRNADNAPASSSTMEVMLEEREDELKTVRKQMRGLRKQNDTLATKIERMRRKRGRGERLTLAESTMVDAWDDQTPLPTDVETFFDGYAHDSAAHWMLSDQTKWRVVHFGDTKYSPGSVMTRTDVVENSSV